MDQRHRILGLCALGLGACVDPSPSPQAAETPPPPAIQISGERTDLIFSYRPNASAEFQTATTIEEVPQDARQKVVVTDLSLTPQQRQASKYVYIANLSKPRSDGTYPVSILSRYGWEAELAKTSSQAIASAKDQVIVYSASWCGVCKRTKKLLKSLKVPFLEKDIEGSKKAREELARKAAQEGIQPTGVPVIDVGGIILQGLDPETLKAALQAKGFL